MLTAFTSVAISASCRNESTTAGEEGDRGKGGGLRDVAPVDFTLHNKSNRSLGIAVTSFCYFHTLFIPLFIPLFMCCVVFLVPPPPAPRSGLSLPPSCILRRRC